MVLTVDDKGSTAVSSLIASRCAAEPAKCPWDAVIHMGLEYFARGLLLETVGANVKAQGAAHNSLVFRPNAMCNASIVCDPIVPDGPDLLAASWHMGLLNPSTTRPPKWGNLGWSRDAGTYYCNET